MAIRTSHGAACAVFVLLLATGLAADVAVETGDVAAAATVESALATKNVPDVTVRQRNDPFRPSAKDRAATATAPTDETSVAEKGPGPVPAVTADGILPAAVEEDAVAAQNTAPVVAYMNIPGHWGDWRGRAFCTLGKWINGMATRVEGRQGLGDDTALNSVQVNCADVNSQAPVATFNPGALGNWGTWSGWQMCPYRQHVVAFRMQIEAMQGGGDDSAGNSVEMRCSDGSILRTVNSNGWGAWTAWQTCPAGTAACAFQIRLEASQGPLDDTAMNGLEMGCCRK